EKKMANVDYFELLHILEFKKAERVKDCAEVLEYKVSYETGEKTLYRVWFCKSRLCPMCKWRRAMKNGIQSQMVDVEDIKKKITKDDYIKLLHKNEIKKAESIKDCADVLKNKVIYETGEKTLYRVWFCKSRLCPMCNWRRAMKHGIQSQKVVAEVIKQKPTVRWLFLTLTVRNVYDGIELNKSLS